MMKGEIVQIRWDNIFGALLLIFCIYVFIKLMPIMHQWFESVRYGFYFPAESPAMKVMLLGLLCVSAVAIVKIIMNNRR